MRNTLESLRERVNIFIYSAKNATLSIFRSIGLLVSISAIALITYYYGFPLKLDQERLIFNLIEITFGFYLLHFLIRLFFDFHPREFLKRNWLEAIIMLLLFIEGISKNIFGVLLLEKLFLSMGFRKFSDFSTVFVQVYLLAAALIDLSRRSNLGNTRIKLHPSTIFIFIFLLLISVGTAFLMLPEMTTQEGSMPFLDALFTSTSASCVTGLAVKETATFFTFKGQFVLLILIKLGGINMISFATFTALFSKFGFGVKHHEVIEDFMSKDNLLSSKGLFGKLVIATLAIEMIGAVLIYYTWDHTMVFDSFEDKVFHSVFHSISAFNNAGFSTIEGGLFAEATRYTYLLHIVIGILVFAGAMGVTVILEMFSLKEIRKRLEYPWKKLSANSKINTYMSLTLLIGGAIVFMFLEQDNALAGKNSVEQIITSFFSSITTRSAGFNTVDFETLTLPSILLVLFLMFVGAAPASTGGGIKTSTFFVLISSTYATITGRNIIEFDKRTIPNELLSKALSVVFYASSFIFVSTFILTITESESLQSGAISFTQLFFEEVSAFSTVGLSMNYSPLLSDAGKTIIAINMFVGRIGTLTIAYVITKNRGALKYRYPDVNLLIG